MEIFVILWNPTRFLEDIETFPLSLAFPNEHYPLLRLRVGKEALRFMVNRVMDLEQNPGGYRSIHVFTLDVGDDEEMEKTLWDMKNVSWE